MKAYHKGEEDAFMALLADHSQKKGRPSGSSTSSSGMETDQPAVASFFTTTSSGKKLTSVDHPDKGG